MGINDISINDVKFGNNANTQSQAAAADVDVAMPSFGSEIAFKREEGAANRFQENITNAMNMLNNMAQRKSTEKIAAENRQNEIDKEQMKIDADIAAEQRKIEYDRKQKEEDNNNTKEAYIWTETLGKEAQDSNYSEDFEKGVIDKLKSLPSNVLAKIDPTKLPKFEEKRKEKAFEYLEYKDQLIAKYGTEDAIPLEDQQKLDKMNPYANNPSKMASISTEWGQNKQKIQAEIARKQQEGIKLEAEVKKLQAETAKTEVETIEKGLEVNEQYGNPVIPQNPDGTLKNPELHRGRRLAKYGKTQEERNQGTEILRKSVVDNADGVLASKDLPADGASIIRAGSDGSKKWTVFANSVYTADSNGTITALKDEKTYQNMNNAAHSANKFIVKYGDGNTNTIANDIVYGTPTPSAEQLKDKDLAKKKAKVIKAMNDPDNVNIREALNDHEVGTGLMFGLHIKNARKIGNGTKYSNANKAYLDPMGVTQELDSYVDNNEIINSPDREAGTPKITIKPGVTDSIGASPIVSGLLGYNATITSTQGDFNRKNNPNSLHNKGRAFDVVVDGDFSKPMAAKKAAEMNEKLKNNGIKGRVVDEYNGSSPDKTGNHFHFEFETKEDMDKARSLFGGSAQPTSTVKAGQGIAKKSEPAKQQTPSKDITIKGKDGSVITIPESAQGNAVDKALTSTGKAISGVAKAVGRGIKGAVVATGEGISTAGKDIYNTEGNVEILASENQNLGGYKSKYGEAAISKLNHDVNEFRNKHKIQPAVFNGLYATWQTVKKTKEWKDKNLLDYLQNYY